MGKDQIKEPNKPDIKNFILACLSSTAFWEEVERTKAEMKASQAKSEDEKKT